MLEEKHRSQFMALLQGDLQLTELSDEVALIFARVIAAIPDGEYPNFTGVSPTEARNYLEKVLDTAATATPNKKASADDLAGDAFGDDEGFHARIAIGSKKSHIPEDWQPLFRVYNEMVGGYHAIKMLIFTSHQGAPHYSDCIRKTEGGYVEISPTYKEWLVAKNIPRPIALAPPEVKSGWQSASAIHQSGEYIGSNVEINKKFIRLRNNLIQAEKEAGKSDAEAEQWVEQNAIGTYRPKNSWGQEALFAAPWVIDQMKQEGLLRLKKDAAPLRKKGWKSASMLCESGEYVGRSSKINQDFLIVRQQLIEEKKTESKSPEEAEQWVEQNAIGTYRSESGMGIEALSAAPWVIAQMEAEGTLRLQNDAAPPAPLGFQSVQAMHSSKKYIAAKTTITKKLWGVDISKPAEEESVFAKLVMDVAHSLGISNEEALQLAEDNLAGVRKPRLGKEGMMFGVDMLRVALQEGSLKRRDGVDDIPNEEITALKNAREKSKKRNGDKEKS